ncbi:MAG TPA: NAD(P)/FAD-dependent oxidoreductase, partial [Polyangiaceae bacterium]|nr:NAD(P)/FAD-dependent oxidoreductase [Polyangiaceae bacterium]
MPVRPLPDEVELELELDEPDDEPSLRARVARKLARGQQELPELVVLKRSIDARRGRVRFHVLVGFERQAPSTIGGLPPREVHEKPRVVIVGGGPAGLFCAYELARSGVAAWVLDRGKPVQPRRHDLKGLNRRGEVDPNSNYCFGEGGAGTYSDGKLYTRAHKRGSVRDVIEILVAHGAPSTILVDARPHIGSNRLPKVVTALREHLESVGQRFVFGARMTEVSFVGAEGALRVRGVRLADGSEIEADAVVLCTGHSARDVFESLHASGVALEAKAFALGVRIEHPQPLINRIQYGERAGHPKLP